MKKLFSVFIILVLLSSTVYATNYIQINADNLIVSPGEELNITFRITNLAELEQGINVIKGKLEYDSNLIEEIQAKDFIIKNNWNNLLYNQETKEFILINDKDIKQDEDVFTITIKLKENIENTKLNLSLKECQISEGIQDINVSDTSIEFEIIDNDSSIDNDNENSQTDNTNEENKTIIINSINKENIINNDGSYDGVLPNTGKKTNLWIPILLIFFSILLLYNYKKNKHSKIFLLLLICSVILSNNIVNAIIIGDINNDGELNKSDVSLMQRYLIHLDDFTSIEIKNADINEDNLISVTDLSLLIRLINEGTNDEIDKDTYLIELDRFNIRNDGIISDTNATGITDAIKYAETEGYKRVLFPKGTYTIKAPTPISIDSKNLIIDLNESTIKMQDEQYEEQWKLLDVKETSEDLIIENGILEGNRFSKYFDYSNKYNEWTMLMLLGGDNITVDNIVFKDAPGYGVGTVTGNGSTGTNGIYLYPKHFEFGNISEDGSLVNDNTKMRNNTFFDISKFGSQFEMGYSLGYQGYSYLKTKEYITCFYDENEKFITQKKCNQFVKVDVPQNAKYVKFVINQTEFESTDNTLAWISNIKGFRNSTVKNCTFEHNATLGLATGGQNIVYEGNKFIENGIEIDGNKARNPAAAVDMEDAWELMQNITFRNNTFEGNRFDIISCAGDGLVIENNYFDAGIVIYGRTTNYTVKDNIIDSKSSAFTLYQSTYGGHIYNNTYKNARVTAFHTTWQNGPIDIKKEVATFENEKFINTQIDLTPYDNIEEDIPQILKNSYITGKKEGTPFIEGICDGCTFEDYTCYDIAQIINSNIINSKMQCEYDSSFENSTIKNSEICTQSADNINIDTCTIENTSIIVNTWADAVNISIKNCNINNTDEEKNILRLSAGKAKNIVLTDNIINSIYDIIDIYDTTYSTPNGMLYAENNIVTIPEDSYFVTGKEVKSGNYSIELKNNTILKGLLINSIFKDSEFLNVSLNN